MRTAVAAAARCTDLVAASAAAATSPAGEQAPAQRSAPVARLVERPTECGPGEPFTPTDDDEGAFVVVLAATTEVTRP